MKSSISILVIVLSVGAYFFYIKPLTAEIRSLSVKKSEYDSVLNKVKEIKSKRDAILLDYNSITEDEIDKLNKIIPDKIDAVVLANDLSALGARYGIILKEVKVVGEENLITDEVAEVSEKVYKTTRLTFNLSGSYTEFLSFLTELESAVSLLDVTSLTISPGSQSSSSSYSYILEANAYSLR